MATFDMHSDVSQVGIVVQAEIQLSCSVQGNLNIIDNRKDMAIL